MRFRTKVFLSAFAVAAVSLLVATGLASWSLRREMTDQVERNLANEARLAARLMSERAATGDEASLDAEADSLGALVNSRVTLIAADGRVLGDSAVSGAALAALENHGHRPEVIAALAGGTGTARRQSSSVHAQMVYVAVRVDHGPVAVVRLALPLTDVASQANAVLPVTLFSLLLALIGAGTLAWISSNILSRRLDELANLARRYASGDAGERADDRPNDELGSVARVLDDSVQALGRRVGELANERARVEAILSGMVEGVFVVGAGGDVQMVNDAARRMLHLGDVAVGRPYVDVIRHPDVAQQIAHALAGEWTSGVELSSSRDAGRVFVARAAPVTGPGDRSAVLVLHDITDLRRADRVRRDFIANVSHELRTPLTAVRGYVEALLDAPPGPEDTRRFLEIIERHAARMERLVKDLLRLARLDAGQETLERAPCRVDDLLSGVVAELLPTLASRSQEVGVQVAPEGLVAFGDGVKLHDILRNLVENASNYSPEHSRITLEAARKDDDVVLRVCDQGPGIPESDRQRIFERFYRVDKARSRETGGTGLGLSIVRHLVELHGGEVSADSRPEGGAVFTIRLRGAAMDLAVP